MREIRIENYANQIATITPASDLIVKDISTGCDYYYSLGQWKRYYGMASGGNIALSDLASSVPMGSIANVNVIDSPFVIQPVNNFNYCNSIGITQAAITTFGWGFVSEFTTKITQVKVICTVAGAGTITVGLYSSNGTLIGKSAPITAIQGFMTLPISLDASGNAISSVSVTGGNLYYWAISCSSATTAFQGFTGMNSLSSALAPLQVTAATAIPNTVTLNAGSRTISPWIALVSGV
jgi:hypothetical protein